MLCIILLVGIILPSTQRHIKDLDLGDILTFKRNFSLEDVHVEGTERIAEAVAKYDVDRYIHVSSHNASVDSPSEFFATKVCPGAKPNQTNNDANIVVLGTRRACCQKHLSRDNHRTTSTNVWIRG